MASEEERKVEFSRLNLVGKAVFVTGTTVRFVGDLLETIAGSISTIITDAEKAFREGADPNIDEAKVLEEHEKEPS